MKKRPFVAALSLFMAVSMSISTFAVTTLTVFAAEPEIVISEGLDAVPDPIDPQSWVLHNDLTWDDYHPNPVIDWMQELNTEGLARPSAVSNPNNPSLNRPVQGGLIMIEYLDRKFISRQPQNSDPTGFYMYRESGAVKLPDGSVKGMEDTVTRNPVVSGAQMVADEKYNGDISKVTDTEFAQWWADYLNKPQELNNYTSIDEYYRENTFGKWAIDLHPYGPFTIPYFEFETMGYDMGSSFQTYRDVPPSFRAGTSGTSNQASFDTVAIPFARDAGVPYSNLDFFFLLHAGYDESGVWQQLGMAQFSSRKDIPYELGPGPRMTEVEAFFTENPDYLTMYATRYANTPSRDFWSGERDKYAALVAAGTQASYEFHLPQSDWDWVKGYNDQTTRNTRYVGYTCWAAAVGEWSHMSTASAANTGAGRTIRYSTQGENDGMGTFAHEFGHIGELPDQYQLAFTINNSPLTEPWDAMSRGQLGGPFGYHTRWEIPGIQGGTVATNYTMRNKIALKSYDMATANPSGTIPANGAKADDILEVKISDLAAGTPLVVDVVARNIPLNNKGLYPQLDQYGLYSPNFYKGVQLAFDYSTNATTQATLPYRDKAPKKITGWTWTHRTNGSNLNTDQPARWMGIEVVDMNGYDSFAPDHGVILTRIGNEDAGTNRQFSWNAIDSHLYDIGLVDYMVPGVNGAEDDYVAWGIGQGIHLWDGAFHAGKSFVDTGYYRTEYDPADPHYNEDTPRKLNTTTFDLEWKKAMIKPGSQQRWEEQDGREIASGDTVNEWYDEYNDLHFYVLSYNKHDGRTLPGNTKPEQFISYTMGVLHGEAPGVGGNLEVTLGKLTTANPGKVAVQEYIIKNTGEATDIVRINVGGTLGWNTTILNDLYAIGAGEEITVPVYIEIPENVDKTVDQTLTLTASSESNDAKISTVTVENIQDKACTLGIVLTASKTDINKGDALTINAALTKTTASNVAVVELEFDPLLFTYNGYTLPAGATFISTGGSVSAETGKSKVMVTFMLPDYAMKGLASFNFVANKNIVEDIKIAEAGVSLAVRGADGIKEIVKLSTTLDSEWKWPIDDFTLILLSNAIDHYGKTSKSPDWADAKRYDFNNDGRINIQDIGHIAMNIKL